MTFSNAVFYDADRAIIPYDGSPVTWRVSAYAIVIKDGQLLIIKNRTEQLYDIPGGGLELGESLEQALSREAMEEAGAQVKIGPIVHSEISFFYHRELKRFYETCRLFYTAELVGELVKPTEPNIDSVHWVPVAEIKNYPLPGAVAEAIALVLKVA